MKQNIKNIFWPLALTALLGTALFSCSFFTADTSNDTGAIAAAAPDNHVMTVSHSEASVVFAIDASTAREISESAGTDGQTLYMDVTLEGLAPSRSATYTINNGSVVSFEKIPANSVVRAVATAYVKTGAAKQKKDLYSGKSNWTVVNSGRNPLTLPLDRIFYVTFFANGGTWTTAEPQDVHYQKGETVKLPTSADIAREGWLFAGWCTSDDGGTTLKPFTFTNETSGDLELYAKWMECAVEGISITVNRETADIKLSYEAYDDPTDGPCVKFTATPPQTEAGATYDYKWMVDETVLGLNETYTFIKSVWTAGVYDISVTVTETVGGNGKKYSAFAQVKVD